MCINGCWVEGQGIQTAGEYCTDPVFTWQQKPSQRRRGGRRGEWCVCLTTSLETSLCPAEPKSQDRSSCCNLVTATESFLLQDKNRLKAAERVTSEKMTVRRASPSRTVQHSPAVMLQPPPAALSGKGRATGIIALPATP